MVKIKAFDADIFPDGMSLALVRGFLASISLSKYLLKAIAAFLASTIQNTIKVNFNQENEAFVVFIAKKKPIKANGIANMVCEKVTNEKYFFILKGINQSYILELQNFD